MPLFKTQSAAIYGIDARLIDVEVDMYASGSARESRMVGMPDVAVRESRERIKSAMMNSGFGYPSKTVTINLAPTNVRREGAGVDPPVDDRPAANRQVDDVPRMRRVRWRDEAGGLGPPAMVVLDVRERSEELRADPRRNGLQDPPRAVAEDHLSGDA